jgi:hypothetical protein
MFVFLYLGHFSNIMTFLLFSISISKLFDGYEMGYYGSFLFYTSMSLCNANQVGTSLLSNFKFNKKKHIVKNIA